MNKNFSALKPEAVWRHFEKIMSIPHPSLHEAALRDYIKGFAADHNLECIEDKTGNVIIRKGATAGMESRQGIILQGHIDMVPQRDAEREFDFLTDPIEGYIDGEWVRANGTTLGADNGVGAAAALAILEDETLAHPMIEALFTVNEERGMDGAFGLEAGVLQGDILLNLDTEEESELCIGCAGGLNLVATLNYESEPTPQGDYVARRLEVSALRGGHSGCEIHEQRGNANKLLFRLLRLTKLELLIAAVDGGTLHNAIPREAHADILIHRDDLALFEEQVARYESTIRNEYGSVESGINVTLSEIEYPSEMIEEDAAACLVWGVAAAHDGVWKMSYTMLGLVQSSSNLATIKSREGEIRIEISLRSSCESEITALADTIASTFELADFEVSCEGGYPGWQPNVESPILKTMSESYRKLFSKEPNVLAVHAGLECGIIGATYPNLDMISFGPTILSPHSPSERVEIGSVERFYQLLRYTIENTPEK
ncbi:MAG: aminoacyl-histidine dipeptidase [Rikenellaceae bacterium]